jgi:hypothetical protein
MKSGMIAGEFAYFCIELIVIEQLMSWQRYFRACQQPWLAVAKRRDSGCVSKLNHQRCCRMSTRPVLIKKPAKCMKASLCMIYRACFWYVILRRGAVWVGRAY